jgi:hypothetical protein
LNIQGGTVELDVTESVESFRKVLVSSWSILSKLREQDLTGSFIDDWIQANWERIVEASIDPALRIVLEPYGEGADCNIRSSRVWRPDASPNAQILLTYFGNEPLVDVIDNKEIDGPMVLDHFCAIIDGWPAVNEPFDHIVLNRNSMVVIPARDLRYRLIGLLV